jgi:hypothetical protein
MREECNPRRSLLVMLVVFCLLVMLLVIFLRRTDQDVREAVSGSDKHKSQSAGAITDWTKPRAAMARLTNALPPVVSDSGSARENDAELNKVLDGRRFSGSARKSYTGDQIGSRGQSCRARLRACT